MTTWLPPPVPVWRPSVMNFSAPSRVCLASAYKSVVMATASRQEAAGWTFTSITPGSGVTLITPIRGS